MSVPQSDLPQPSAPSPAYVPPTPTGALPYGLGFLACIPIPWANTIIAGIVMAAVYPSQKRKGPIAAENARRAANWGLTIATITVALIVLVIILGVAANGNQALGPLAFIPVVIWLVLGIVHLVIIIRGLIVAGRGELYVNQIAIPFIRGKAAEPVVA